MKIQIQHIPSQGLALAYGNEARTFPVLKQLMDDGQCRFLEPIAVDLSVVSERDLITIDGVLATRVELACSRCLELFQMPLRHRFTLRYSREIPTDLHSGTGEPVALTAEQIGLVYFKGEEIDFQDSIQEQVVLALPFKPLCREDCQGLCPRCGADLNQGRCECGGVVIENPFAVLKNRQWPEQ
ncbi:MAG: DUF177 domain-containing protein [Desulfatitalea sp.]|nr:DUF177 domain-containing protein [Desulfatitalea sp.]